MAKKTQKSIDIDLDKIDFKLMRALLVDARISHVDLAEKVGLSATACARRIQHLEARGIIKGYRVDLDAAQLGCGATVMVHISLERQSEELLAAFEREVARCADVVSCHLMAGSDDYLVQVAARDIEDYERIHKQHLSRLPGVVRINSSFALREVTKKPLPERALLK